MPFARTNARLMFHPAPTNTSALLYTCRHDHVATVVCLRNDTKTAYTENPCMYSCGRDDAARTADIADLIYNGGSSWSQGDHCDSESIQSPSPSGGGGGLLFSIGHSLGLLPQSTGGPGRPAPPQVDRPVPADTGGTVLSQQTRVGPSCPSRHGWDSPVPAVTGGTILSR